MRPVVTAAWRTTELVRSKGWAVGANAVAVANASAKMVAVNFMVDDYY